MIPTHVLEIRSFDQFKKEVQNDLHATKNDDESGPLRVARIDTVDDRQPPYYNAAIIVTFKSVTGDIYRFQENFGSTDDPNSPINDSVGEAADEVFSQWVEDLKNRRKQLASELKNLGLDVKDGLWT